MTREISVVYTKYDGSLHWNFRGYHLGEDEFGTWVGMPAGTQGRRGHEPPLTWEHPHVVLFPGDQWWTAVFNADPAPTELYCDISTIPSWHDDTVTMVDLDLDVLRRRGGPVRIVDEDEFAEHQVRYGYPVEVIAAAQDSCTALAERVRAGGEPFASRHLEWLSRISGPARNEPIAADPSLDHRHH